MGLIDGDGVSQIEGMIVADLVFFTHVRLEIFIVEFKGQLPGSVGRLTISFDITSDLAFVTVLMWRSSSMPPMR